MKTILLAASFSLTSLIACGQTTGNQATKKEDLKTQAEQRRNYPDNPNKKIVIAEDKSPDSSTSKPRKKRKCWFGKKKKQQESESPAAKDVLKDRNTKDPRIDRRIQPVEKSNAASKDSLIN